MKKRNSTYLSNETEPKITRITMRYFFIVIVLMIVMCSVYWVGITSGDHTLVGLHVIPEILALFYIGFFMSSVQFPLRWLFVQIGASYLFYPIIIECIVLEYILTPLGYIVAGLFYSVEIFGYLVSARAKIRKGKLDKS